MGGACSARPAATPDTPEPPPIRNIADVRPEIPQRPKRDSPPAAVESLVDLCVRSICLHIDRFQVPGFQLDVARYGASVGDLPPLALPFELSQRVLSRLVDRAWLDYVALGRLSGCVLAAIELPDCAHLTDEWVELIARHHGRTLARVDLSGCPLTDAGVTWLGSCKILRELNLSRCAKLTDKALAALRGLPLEQLRLEQLNLSAAALAAHLAPLAPTLRWLSLAGVAAAGDAAVAAACAGGALQQLCVRKCDAFDDAAAQPLRALPDLLGVQLGWCRKISPSALASLASIATLRELQLEHTRLSDAALGALTAGLPNLRSLSLRGCAISDAALAKVGGLRRLRTLCLRACEAGDAAMAAVATLPKLADLDLGYTEVGDGGLYSLASLGSLTSLSLDSCKLGNAGLRGLRAFPRLTSLDLSDIDVPLLSTEWVASLTSLTSLNLFYSGLTDAGVALLAPLRHLRTLNIDTRSVTDASMPILAASLPALRSLDLFGARITDAGLESLTAIRSLTHLEVCGGGVGDAGAAAVATLSELRSLNFSQNLGISDDGAAHLAAGCPVLSSLNLSNTSVGAGATVSLGQISSLSSLALLGCPIPPSHAAALRAALPRLLVLALDHQSGFAARPHQHDPTPDAAEIAAFEVPW